MNKQLFLMLLFLLTMSGIIYGMFFVLFLFEKILIGILG